MRKNLYPRHLTTELKTALEYFRIINIVGPRQAGKTTLVKELLQKGKYISLDDDDVLKAIEADPKEFLAELKNNAGGEPVIIDEIQRSKKFALALKIIVDNDRSKGQFILAGSSNVFLHKDTADSLIGRVVPLKLWPLTISEIRRVAPSSILDWALENKPPLSQFRESESLSRQEYIQLILAGGFPGAREMLLKQRQTEYRTNIQTIVDRDIQDVQAIRNKDKFRQLIHQLATRTGQEINFSDISNALGIKRDTAVDYVDVMERLSLITRLGAWRSGESRREIKNPKFHFIDTGMSCAIRLFNERTFDPTNPAQISELGGLLESFVFNELLRSLPYQKKQFQLYHWRSADRREIDIIADGGHHIVGIEVKAASTVGPEDFRHLKWFAENGPGQSRKFTGIVFYLGKYALSFADRCYALPVSTFWTPALRPTATKR